MNILGTTNVNALLSRLLCIRRTGLYYCYYTVAYYYLYAPNLHTGIGNCWSYVYTSVGVRSNPLQCRDPTGPLRTGPVNCRVSLVSNIYVWSVQQHRCCRNYWHPRFTCYWGKPDRSLSMSVCTCAHTCASLLKKKKRLIFLISKNSVSV